MPRWLDVATGFLVSGLRNPLGQKTANVGARPSVPIVFYEFEACPFCRKVREAVTMLDLEVEIRPCPKGGPRFREEVKAKGGKYQFPYMVDPNTGVSMYESDDIIKYLYEKYGTSKPPTPLLWSITAVAITGPLAGMLRSGKGVTYRKARAPEKPLELYDMELSPYCRIVREVLTELELPHFVHPVGHHSAHRPEFVKRSGKQMVPYMVDPNTGTQMFESAEIKAYLNRTYAI